MKQFYFNTGVSPANRTHLERGAIWRGNTMQIPFKADAPENALFMFACDNPELPEWKHPNVIVRELFDTTLRSKYGYFRVPT